jgi:hypothetical protein
VLTIVVGTISIFAYSTIDNHTNLGFVSTRKIGHTNTHEASKETSINLLGTVTRTSTRDKDKDKDII